MDIKGNLGIKLHNKFEIVPRDAKTLEVIESEKGYAENIVLDRMYTRLLTFQSFFDQIVFGSGDGTISASRTTLFNRISNKPAVLESLVRSYPTSVITKRIRLETGDHNGVTLTEVGISETTTNINTHAKITDSEGNPIGVPKSIDRIIDIYATTYVELYSVDSGLIFYGNGLRDYLTGGAAPSNVMRLFDFTDDTAAPLTGTRTYDLNEKTVTLFGKFSVYDFNRDVRAIDWHGLGIRWKMPRTGVYTGTHKTNVEIGVGDGVKTKFILPNKEVTNLTIKIDSASTTSLTFDDYDEVTFDTPPANALIVTADYTTKYIPKNENHELEVTMKIGFAITAPAPVMPDPDYTDIPGPSLPTTGDKVNGFFGEIAANDFITGEALFALLGISTGVSINSLAGWLKVAKGSQMLIVSKMCIRHTISWNDLNALGLIYGRKEIGRAHV